MADEPPSKRRRTDGETPSVSKGVDLPAFFTIPLSDVRSSGETFGFENTDPFLSPATASSWPFDEFAHDPDYLASQEALRSLLFTTAQSTAPTRAGSPVGFEETVGNVNLKQTLSVGRRVQYLKNYMSQVAPWVCSPKLLIQYGY